MITRHFTTGERFSAEDAIRLVINVKQLPHEAFKLVFMGDMYFDIGALAVIKLLLDHPDYSPRVSCDISNLNPENQEYLERIGLFGGGAKDGFLFPLTTFSSSYKSGSLYLDVPVWLTRLAREAFRIEDAHLVEAETAIIELIANVVDHCGQRSPGVFGGGYYRGRNHIQLVVADFGDTIPGTLQKMFPTKSDHLRLSEAMKPGVSRRLGVGNNYGLGLDIVKGYSIFDDNCGLIIHSRQAFLSYTKGQLHCNPSRTGFPGTYVKLQLSEAFLRQSLEFDDTPRGFDL